MTRRAIFFGAGLSAPSGLPTANQLVTALFQRLGCNGREIEEFFVARVPFELVIKTIGERTDVVPLLHLYSFGSPCAYHRAMASLARRGEVTTFITTNFDTLLEQAFAKEGMQEGRDFLVYRRPSSFRRIRWDSRRAILVKMHGSVEKPDELGATLERVASQRAIGAARDVIWPLLAGTRCDEVMFAGYSFSDMFDIVPVLNSEPSRANVVVIDHLPCRGGQPRLVPPPARLKLSRVTVLRGRTDALLRQRLGRKSSNAKASVPPSPIRRAEDAVQDWANSIPARFREVTCLYSLGRLFIHAHWFHRAISVLTSAMALAEREGGVEWMAELHLNLGICHYRLSHHRDAASGAIKAIRLARSVGYDRVHGNAIGNLGNVLYSRKKLDWALRCQQEAARLARETKYRQLEINSVGNIGLILEEMHDFDGAIGFHKRALRGARRIGDPIGVARHLANISICLNRLGRFDDALPVVREAIDRAIETAQPSVEAEALGQRYLIEHAAGHAIARSTLDEAIHIATRIGDQDKLVKFERWRAAAAAPAAAFD